MSRQFNATLSLLALLLPFSVVTFVSALTPSTTPADEASDRLAHWKNRWDTNVLGWHRQDINDVLKAHGNQFLNMQTDDEDSAATCTDNSNNNGMRVLVPLCGKSLDLAHFAKLDGVTKVVGVDGIQKALETFATEHPELEIQAKTNQQMGSFNVWQGQNITLLKGDFFQLAHDWLANNDQKFNAVYDRAAMVAIQPDLRPAYVNVIRQVMAPQAKVLLVTVEHDTGTGPPFSISEEDVRQLYGDSSWIESVTMLNPDATQVDGNGRVDRWYMIQTKA